MRHCVGGYAGRCAKGDYVVWHLTKGSEEATLGISSNGYLDGDELKHKYYFNQMYHSCNRVVTDEDFKKTATEIIDKMNKAVKIEVMSEDECLVYFQGEEDDEPEEGPWCECYCDWRVKPKEPETCTMYLPIGSRKHGDAIIHHTAGVYYRPSPIGREFVSSDTNYEYKVVANIKIITEKHTGAVLACELIKS